MLADQDRAVAGIGLFLVSGIRWHMRGATITGRFVVDGAAEAAVKG